MSTSNDGVPEGNTVLGIDTDQSDKNSFEGPDVETSPSSKEPDGLGKDGTIPSDPDGIAAGHTGAASTFEPEEDDNA
jgi:hypothetical protein